jgi:catechol 2,3-dioxygenase-like lactoylglutathione lyase family enzyme
MLGGCRLVAFVATTDVDRARRFYGEVLGLKLLEEGPFACVYDANGTQLRVTPVDRVDPPPYTVLGWAVDAIENTVKALGSAGVEMQQFGGMGQDPLGIWTAPGGDRVAWFKDPDGHTLSVSQHVPS